MKVAAEFSAITFFFRLLFSGLTNMRDTADPRHLARVIIVQKMFERQFVTEDIGKGYSGEYSEKELAEIGNFKRVDKGLAKKLLKGIRENYKGADKLIEKYATEWPLSQIPKVDLQILRLAIYEGFLSKTTPEKVAIDEAIELAKELGGPNSAKFVNGVLGNLISKINNDRRRKKTAE
ncbi:transcription antitermination factor NusB [Candidatus Dojkabacteria bacterium]|nr:transcription antitermination factor NusB [Candidatus Dojkabacteria bacterium]